MSALQLQEERNRAATGDVATAGKPGTYLREVAAGSGSDADKLRRSARAALSREPTPKVTAAFTRLIRQRTRTTDRRNALASTLQDVCWAYLNSNEFTLVIEPRLAEFV